MLLASDNSTAVIGLGLTGLSMARYFARCGRSFVAFDEKVSDESRLAFEAEFPNAHLVVAPLTEQDFTGFNTIALSPGVPLATPSLAAAKDAGVSFVNDVTLFLDENATKASPAKIVAVTGSNGKSTVVSWLHHALVSYGQRSALAGNIGTSPLTLLDEELDSVVLELSSFQLEVIDKLAADVACILNLSPDHLDRYDSMLAYHSAKQRIYRSAKYCVSNKQDALTSPLLASMTDSAVFSSLMPDLKEWGLLPIAGDIQLCFGPKRLIKASDLPITGKHNALNALSVLALAKGLGIAAEDFVPHLQGFNGLAHRCELVASHQGVQFVNDSKATNVGATVSAVNGLANDKRIILIAGGVAKGADLAPLSTLSGSIKHVVVMGDAADELAEIFAKTGTSTVTDMESAVATAIGQSSQGDIVLLSPACASFDMFKNYIDRGDQFKAAVKAVVRA